MPELLTPDTFERLQICAEVIRDEADQYDDNQDAELRIMARNAVAAMVPEFRKWKGSRLEIATDGAFYTAIGEESAQRLVQDETFYMRGIFSDGVLRQIITPLDEKLRIASMELCMRFDPSIEAQNPLLHQTEQAVVPISALRELRVET